jgi:hypothetical protein
MQKLLRQYRKLRTKHILRIHCQSKDTGDKNFLFLIFEPLKDLSLSKNYKVLLMQSSTST